MKRLPQILISTIAWIVGLALAQSNLSTLPWSAVIVASISIFVVFRIKTRLGYLLLIVGFVILGMWRGQLAIAQLPMTTAGLIGEKVILTGRVSSEPGWNNDRLHEFVITEVQRDGKPIDGSLKIKTLVGNALEGQRVQVEGKVGRALGQTPAQIWYATTTTIDVHRPYPVRLKNLLSSGLSVVLPPTQAGFVRGLLFGSRAAIPPDLERALQRLGLTHIVAVSGYNLTIIVAGLSIFVRRQTRTGFLLTMTGIGFFTVMTGASAPIVRAAVMSVLFLLVGRARRQLDAKTAVLASIIVMTAWNPLYLYRDVGWQLSVLALLGVLWLAPLFMPRPGKRVWLARELLAGTLGAYIATAPFIAYTFGTFSLIAPLANLLVLPLIPLIMLLGFIAALAGVLLPMAAPLFLQVRWLVAGVLWLIVRLAGINWAQAEVTTLYVQEVVASYVVIVMLCCMGRNRSALQLAMYSKKAPQQV